MEPKKEHIQQEAQLSIFVNRRKFYHQDGVRKTMTGEEIAALVDVPAANATVRYGDSHDKREIGLDEQIHVHPGEHFIVTRKVVEGGHCASAD